MNTEQQNGKGLDDRRLSGLLQEWKSPEPRPSFEADVWRRIRTEPEAGAWSAAAILRDRLLSPAIWARTAAVTMAAAVGVAGALHFNGQTGREPEPLLQSHTIAGAYLAMSSGDRR